jgi:hypothetical protein
MTDLTLPAHASRLPAGIESRTDECLLHATLTQDARPLRDTEPVGTWLHGAQAEPRQAQTRDSPVCLLQDSPDLHTAKLRCMELEADLAAQRVSSGRALAGAWTVIFRLRTEQAEIARWQADRQRQLENWETDKRNWEADRLALLAGCEADKQQLLKAWQSDKQALELRIAALTASTSWRMTAPMRIAGRQVRTILTMLRRRH